MSDPTSIPPAPRTGWRPSFGQVRLAILMAALVFGIMGMTQGDTRMVNVAIAVGMVGVILRFVGRRARPTP